MPNIFHTHNGTVEHRIYQNESELPRNAKIFMRELRKDLPNDEIKLYRYDEIKNLEDGKTQNELTLTMDMDAERYAKDEYSYIKDADNKFDRLADALGIDRWYISTPYINKKEFAEKFLKDLKKYMKSTGDGDSIHSIRFDLTSKYEMEIKIILKKDWVSQRSEYTIKNLAKDYLKSQGYKNIRVYIP